MYRVFGEISGHQETVSFMTCTLFMYETLDAYCDNFNSASNTTSNSQLDIVYSVCTGRVLMHHATSL